MEIKCDEEKEAEEEEEEEEEEELRHIFRHFNYITIKWRDMVVCNSFDIYMFILSRTAR